MENSQLKEKILSLVPEAIINEGNQFLEALIPAEKLHGLALQLKQKNDLDFDFLFCLSGVDWLKYITIVYHLESIKYKHSMVMKVNLDRNSPNVDTVCDIWKTAEFHEREVYDLMGVHFNNHPDLRRLFLDEDWKGHPLLKDYMDDIHIVERN
jgi:NADH-quinone oxidoreductase subunit C